MIRKPWILSALGLGMVVATGAARAQDQGAVVNVYNWSDYIADEALSQFTKETGIAVNYDVFDSNEMLEGKLLAGHSGYDVVVPTDYTLATLIKVGALAPLDKTALPNLANLDPDMMARAALHDPGNAHGVIYMWGTAGLGLNREKVLAALGPDAPMDSFALLFDPTYAAKLASCGITMLDSGPWVLSAALNYLGLDPNSEAEADLDKAEALLMTIRPHVRRFDSAGYIEALVNGDICLAYGYSGDVFQAQSRAKEAGLDDTIDYVIPKEGTQVGLDMLAVPADAPNPKAAHALIDFLSRPDIAALNTNYVWYANANTKATPLVDADVRTNPAIYPQAAVMARLYARGTPSPEGERAITRAWTRIKSGI
jgi:putrescine transport system substrate-binding protein